MTWHNQLEVLQWLHEQKCPWDWLTTAFAAKRAREHVCLHALKFDHTEMLLPRDGPVMKRVAWRKGISRIVVV